MKDTGPSVERVHIDLLRRAGSVRRATIASDLTNAALARARRGIAAAHPELSDLGRQLLFVEVHYGRELAARMRAWLRAKGRDVPA